MQALGEVVAVTRRQGTIVQWPGTSRPTRAGAVEVGESAAGTSRGELDRRLRILDAAIECFASTGIRGTALHEIARRAGCSRATLYRMFPGGRDDVISGVVDLEASRLFSAVAVRVGRAETLEEGLSEGIHELACFFQTHTLLMNLIERDPEMVLPHLSFGGLERVIAGAVDLGAPLLGRWVDHRAARRFTEWAVRFAMGYVLSPPEGTDISDSDAALRMVERYILPGILLSTGYVSPVRAAAPPGNAAPAAGNAAGAGSVVGMVQHD